MQLIIVKNSDVQKIQSSKLKNLHVLVLPIYVRNVDEIIFLQQKER
jgi:hypothetical protein